MCKKVLISMLMLGICMVGFSQTNTGNISNPKDAAKVAVENSQKELLDKMQRRLKDRNEPKPNKEFNKLTEAQQFLFKESLIDSVLKAKSHNLKDVFRKLCDKANMPTDFVYEGINLGEITYKTIESGKKQGQIDSTTLIVPVTFQTHTIAKEGVSNAKYTTTFKWEVKVKQDKKTGEYQIKDSVLVSSVATPVQFLNSDKRNMKDASLSAIVEWYENLPQTLDKQYAIQSVTAIRAMKVSPSDIKMDLPQGRTFTVSDVPAITISIDPYQFINESDKQLYTDPVASLTVAPVFNVTIDESNRNASVSVEYTEKGIAKPIFDKEKETRRNKADAVVAEFAQMLASYVASRDAGKKADIEGLFNSEDNVVEVSYLRKNGTERITTKPVQKYLSLLKGTDLNMVVDDVEVLNPNWDSVIYTVNQKFHSKPYSDNTIKKIHMTYDPAKGTYIINKLEVVPSSTKLID